MANELADLLGRGRTSRYFHGTSKPFVRWWWLSGPFSPRDIAAQLQWIRDQNFGGVELAWIYPGWLEEEEDDRTRPVLLSQQWSDLLAFTKAEADALGLGCDFTFGSCWPFGGSWLNSGNALQTFGGLSEQRLRCSWEVEVSGPTFVLNHLSAAALSDYSEPLLQALEPALHGSSSALFCDSLELDTDEMWSDQLWAEFEQRFGYSLRPFVEDLDDVPDVRYDYRVLISEAILSQFYRPFTVVCNKHGAFSRVQCHGAPTDLIQAYAAVDIPESESLLFPPAFSRIAASAAAWRGKEVVSAEAFTCIYGFPGREESAEAFWKQESIADLKLLADALFANGVNQIVWHGMPYQPAGKEVEFYASVHVGPDSPFAAELPAFNAYLEKVSALLKLGRSYSGAGVYLPVEDALMRDLLPDEERTPGANYHWEMRNVAAPAELAGHHPIWISLAFLKEARVEQNRIWAGSLSLDFLYLDCEWLDLESLTEFERLTRSGAATVWRRRCRQPGRKQDASYESILDQILSRSNVEPDPVHMPALLVGEDLPWYWARVLEDRLLIFFAHPLAKEIRYPMAHGFADAAIPAEKRLTVRWQGHEVSVELSFAAGESLFLVVEPSGRAATFPL